MKEQRKQKERQEGNGISQLTRVIQKFGYNQDVNFELGTVTAPPPELKIKLDNVKDFELDKDDLIVAEYLTKHKRRINIIDTGSTDISDDTAFGDTTSTVDVTSIYITNGDINIRDGEMEFLDELKVGDRVILANYNDGQSYIVLDRMVTYGA